MNTFHDRTTPKTDETINSTHITNLLLFKKKVEKKVTANQ